MNVFRITTLPLAILAIGVMFASPALTQEQNDAEKPSWADDCASHLKKSGEHAFCAVGVSESTTDEFFCLSQGRQRAREGLGTTTGSLVFKAIEKSKCWASGMAPSVAVIKVSESATERVEEWTSKDNRCFTFLKMNLHGFQKTVYRTCGLPDGKEAEIFAAAKEIWDAHWAGRK